MAYRVQQCGPMKRWACDTYADLASVTALAAVGDLVWIEDPGVELQRRTVDVGDGTPTRWIPTDPRWGANSLPLTPCTGSATSEGVWTISASDTLADADINTSHDCLALIIDHTAGDVTLDLGPTNRPGCLQLRGISLQTDGANAAEFSATGAGLAGGTGGAGVGPVGTGVTTTALHGQFTCCGCGGGGGGAEAGGSAGGNGGGVLGQYWGAPTGALGAGGAAGSAGSAATSATYVEEGFASTSLGGNVPVGAGGGAGGAKGGDNGKNGGAGGGAFVLAFAEIVNDVTVSAEGAAGTTTANTAGAGGGGGGGFVRVLYRRADGTVTTSVAGGTGGTTSGGGKAGGAGGNGIALVMRV